MIQISYGNTRTNLIGFLAAGRMKRREGEQMMTEFPLSEDFKIHVMGLWFYSIHFNSSSISYLNLNSEIELEFKMHFHFKITPRCLCLFDSGILATTDHRVSSRDCSEERFNLKSYYVYSIWCAVCIVCGSLSGWGVRFWAHRVQAEDE